MRYIYEKTIIEPNTIPQTVNRGRGRPKQDRPKRDLGTPELRRKRAQMETAETLDLCLEKGIINHSQHWCGIHFRWLYTLRYGAPSVQAIRLHDNGFCKVQEDDENWREAREFEYEEAALALDQAGHMKHIINICVFNEHPAFLLYPANRHVQTERTTEYERLLAGLDILKSLWRKPAVRP